MTRKELMIGDWVFVENKPYKVASLSCMGNPELESDKYIFHCLKDKIVPIPLTPKILVKNGFVKSKNGELTLELDDVLGATEIVLVPTYDEAYYWWRVNNELITTIKSIHELQHVLRLCRINKEIKL